MTLRELTLEELRALHDTELREAFPPGGTQTLRRHAHPV